MPDYLVGLTIETNNLHYIKDGNVLIGTAQLVNDLYAVFGCTLAEPSPKVAATLDNNPPIWLPEAIKLPISMSHRFVGSMAAVSAALPFDKTNEEKFYLLVDAINYVLTSYGGQFDFEFSSESEFIIKQSIPDVVQLPSDTDAMIERIRRMKRAKELTATEYAKSVDIENFQFADMMKMLEEAGAKYGEQRYEYEPSTGWNYGTQTYN